MKCNGELGKCIDSEQISDSSINRILHIRKNTDRHKISKLFGNCEIASFIEIKNKSISYKEIVYK